MKILLVFTLGLYAALGPLCPMQLQAATVQRESAVSMMTVVHAESMEHGEKMHGVVSSHADCGEEDHCRLGETVESAGVDAVQEILSTHSASVIPTNADTAFFDASIVRTMVDRPPPLSPLITVVLRQ